MQKYRLYKLDYGNALYLQADGNFSQDRRHAGLFTEAEYLKIGGKEQGLYPSPLGEDEAMKLAGAPMLPGFGGEK